MVEGSRWRRREGAPKLERERQLVSGGAIACGEDSLPEGGKKRLFWEGAVAVQLRRRVRSQVQLGNEEAGWQRCQPAIRQTTSRVPLCDDREIKIKITSKIKKAPNRNDKVSDKVSDKGLARMRPFFWRNTFRVARAVQRASL